MDYYCEICDKTIKLQSEKIQFKYLTYIQFEKCILINHTTDNPDFFDTDKTFEEYVTNHNKTLIYILLNVILYWYLMISLHILKQNLILILEILT